MLSPIFKKISGLRSHYTRSGLVVSGISFVLIVLFFTVGVPPELMFSESIVRIFATAAFISHLFSNATYIAGTIDLFQQETDDIKIKIERWSTLIGIIVGLALGMYLSFMLAPITFFNFLGMTTVVTGAFSGLGSRIGGLGRRPPLEQGFLGGAGIIGCGMGFYFALTGASLMPIPGIISFAACSSPLITSIIFIFLVTSLCMSGADYAAKSLSYLRHTYEDNRYHEYRGSCWGSALSLLAILFFVTHLDLFTATFAAEGTKLAVATTIALFAKCFGIDGICSRIGRTLDRFFDSNDSDSDKAYKILLVLTGVAAFLVVVDMVFKLAHYFGGDCKPATSPTPTSLSSSLISSPRLTMSQSSREELQSELSEEKTMSETPSSSPDQSPERPVSLFAYCCSFFALRRHHNKISNNTVFLSPLPDLPPEGEGIQQALPVRSHV